MVSDRLPIHGLLADIAMLKYQGAKAWITNSIGVELHESWFIINRERLYM